MKWDTTEKLINNTETGGLQIFNKEKARERQEKLKVSSRSSEIMVNFAS